MARTSARTKSLVAALAPMTSTEAAAILAAIRFYVEEMRNDSDAAGVLPALETVLHRAGVRL